MRPAKNFQAKRILPKNFRDDPFADPPPITEKDIEDGMYSLLNRGIIPRDVDLTPAFERGSAPFAAGKAEITLKEAEKPKHLSYKPEPGAVKYVRRAWKEPGAALPDPDATPDATLHRGNVFLTSMNVEDHEILRLAEQQKAIDDSYANATRSQLKGFQETRESKMNPRG